MIIFPAIDIRNGKCVRLIQGDYNQETIYGDSPAAMALEWQNQGATFIHVIDLDGAKSGVRQNIQAITEIVKSVSVPVQVGGGIRSLESVEAYLEAGVNRVILGTAVIQDKQLLKEVVEKYQEKIVVSIDARGYFVATDGWTETSNVNALELIKELEAIGVKTIVFTDIAKDGMLAGPNFAVLEEMNQTTVIDIIASGGVSTVQDVAKLTEMKMYGAIIGKALYEKNITLNEVLGVEK